MLMSNVSLRTLRYFKEVCHYHFNIQL